MLFVRYLRSTFAATALKPRTVLPSSIVRGVALLGVTLLVSGCSLGSLPSFGGGVFGTKEKKSPETQSRGLSEERLLAAAKLDSTAESGLQTSTSLCTKFKIYNADRFLTVYNVGQYGDGLAVKYRGELTKAGRECAFQPGLVHLKYGFAGRVLLGPKGEAGVVNLPILIHLTDRAGKKIKTEKVTVPVTVDPGKPFSYFSIVRKMDIPLTGGQSGKNFRVFVGFEKIDQS